MVEDTIHVSSRLLTDIPLQVIASKAVGKTNYKFFELLWERRSGKPPELLALILPFMALMISEQQKNN